MTYFSEFLRLLQVGVEVVEGRADAPECDPVLLLEERQRHDAHDAKVAGDVQHKAENVVQVEDRERLALVEPLGFVAAGLEGAHEDIDVIVAQAQQGLVRIYPRARCELQSRKFLNRLKMSRISELAGLALGRNSYLVTYLVQIRLHERIRLLQQVVEYVEGAELPGLPLVVDPT